MGTVYLAEDEYLGRKVALKTIRLGVGEDERVREHLTARFHIEARAVANLQHQNIVTVYQFGEQHGLIFLVMEFLEGGSLLGAMSSGRRFTKDEFLGILRDSAAALDHAHDCGVVHRDVKPANLLLTKTGEVKLSDFGIARITQDTGITGTKQLLGTPSYLAPEALKGEPVDAPLDQYSLGVVAYELLARHRPFYAENMHAVMTQILFQPVPSVGLERDRELTARLDSVFQQVLAKTPSQRFANCRDFVTSLERALAGDLQPGCPFDVDPEEQAWVSMRESTNPSDFRQFLQGRFAERARRTISKLEEHRWRKAIDENTPEAFREFLRHFPEGRRQAQARTRLNELLNAAWAVLATSFDLPGIAMFARQWPNFEAGEQARRRYDWLAAESIRWRKISRDDLDALLGFLSEYPNGMYQQPARERVEVLRQESFEAAKATGNPEQMEKFVARFGVSDVLGAAALKILDDWRREQQVWEQVARSEDPAAIRVFLATYPGGRFETAAHAHLARVEAERLTREWRRLAASYDVEALADFARRAGGSQMGELARTRLDRLTAEARRWQELSTDDAEALQSFLREFPDGRFERRARERLGRLKQDAFESLRARRQPAEAESFIRQFGADDELSQLATRLLDNWRMEESAWNKARDGEGAADLHRFLSEYPGGRFEQEAAGLLESREADEAARAWARLADSTEEGKLREFGQRWGRYPQAQLAHRRLDWLAAEARAWEKLPRHDPDAVSRFARSYPGGRYQAAAEEVLAGLKRREFDRMSAQRTPDDARTFIARYGAADELSLLAASLLAGWEKEEEEWARIGSADEADALADFLARYPQGRFAAQAKERKRALETARAGREAREEWTRLAESNDTDALTGFTRRWTGHQEAGLAQARLKRLTAESNRWSRLPRDNPAALEAFLHEFPDGQHAAAARRQLKDLERAEFQAAQAACDSARMERFLARPGVDEEWSEIGQRLLREWKQEEERRAPPPVDPNAATRLDRGHSVEALEEWNRLKNSTDRDTLIAFIARHAGDPVSLEAKQRADWLATEMAQWNRVPPDDPDSLTRFLRDFRGGRFEGPASERLNQCKERAFSTARESRDPRRMEEYLAQFGSGDELGGLATKLIGDWKRPTPAIPPPIDLRPNEEKPAEPRRVKVKLPPVWLAGAAALALGLVFGIHWIASRPEEPQPKPARKSEVAEKVEVKGPAPAAAEAEKRLRAEREEAAEWTTLRKDDPQALEQFLRLHPAGSHAAEVRSRLMELQGEVKSWEMAQAAADEDSLKAFLARYQTGPHTEAARKLLVQAQQESREAEGMRTSPDEAAIQRFLQSYPRSRHAAEAKARLGEIKSDSEDWTRVMNSWDAKDLSGYLARHPQGRSAGLARQRQKYLEEEAAVAAAVKRSDEASLANYLERFPDSPQAAGLRTRLSELREARTAWSQLRNSRDAAQISAFVTRYGSSPEAEAARARLVEIQAEEAASRKAAAELAERKKAEAAKIAIAPVPAAPKPARPPQIVVNPRDQLAYVMIGGANPPFRIGQTEVTVAAFAAVMGAKAMPGAGLENPGWQKRDLPMVRVSYQRASDYCQAIGGRLPTEMEWETAARAGSAGDFGASHNTANFAGKGELDDSTEMTPVKHFAPTAAGLYDMAGNAAEWVRGEASPVLKGGYWNSPLKDLRISWRMPVAAKDANGSNFSGFRCAAPVEF